VEGSCEHGNEPKGSIKLLSTCTTGDLSRRARLHAVSLVTYRRTERRIARYVKGNG
jgi:hypothetical protein